MKYVIAVPQWIHHIGKRSNQEDALYPYENEANAGGRLFIICDGMGGHELGEVASQTVCQCISQWFDKNYNFTQPLTIDLLAHAIDYAYDGLDAKDSLDTVKKMGTTMILVAFHPNGVTVAHIGDSRIYQIRPNTGEILYKSRDHSLVNDLISIGEMNEEEARTSSKRNIITRAMQPHQPRRSKADVYCLTDIQAGDYFYMCSDGMLENMDDQELVSILADRETTDNIKKQILLEKTQDNKDNHTAFLIHILQVLGSDEINNKLSEKSSDIISKKVSDHISSSSYVNENYIIKVILIIVSLIIVLFIGRYFAGFLSS